jgi:periplasmic divalent cation tolerance protein
MYWWNGEIQKDSEVLVLMETKSELAGMVVQEIAALHSYDVPKILVLEPSQVYQAYQLWLQEETR